MTTFKNNAKYAELLYIYLDVAFRDDNPLTVPEVLRAFKWRFKGGSLREAAEGTRLQPETSDAVFPEGYSEDLARQWGKPGSSRALEAVLRRRAQSGTLRRRAMLARIATYQVLLSDYGQYMPPRSVYIGMKSIYHLFGLVWDWAEGAKPCDRWDQMMAYTRELTIGSCAPSLVCLPTSEERRREYVTLLKRTRAPCLMTAVLQMKDIIRRMGGGEARAKARHMGKREEEKWEEDFAGVLNGEVGLSDPGTEALYSTVPLGPITLRLTQEMVIFGTGETRFALGKSDAERLHQLIMSVMSLMVGVCSQAALGTVRQREKARAAMRVTESNVGRVVRSARLVPLGDEVLVCKGYRRAYTAHLARLAGPLCTAEFQELRREAEATAPEGVLDISGFLADLAGLDAASSLNAAKVFKVCPAPDVSPGTAMMDRIVQIGNSNVVDPEIMDEFTEELRTQILRGHIRAHTGRLKLRDDTRRPAWFGEYLAGNMEKVPSAEIHEYLKWEESATMPEVSPYDPSNWKDSGLGADTIWETYNRPNLGVKKNMLTRLIFDSECPMPGRETMNPEHVIKMFVKAEGHKDPARAIFSSNLADRQAQSWMEKAVERVAIRHPSFMIGQEVDVREARVVELTRAPTQVDMLALYYSFDISGWSAKMPAEPQRISHKLWAELYGGHLFKRATEVNEGAHIYVDIEGYFGWYKNTHSNLEGFNGKEMTMVLIALLSLSVKRWRRQVVEEEVMTADEANGCSALLFAYIDDGLSRLDLPRRIAVRAFEIYKRTVIETFDRCGFSVEVSKCFPSDRFAIFLNEVYLAGRHVVHGVRAAMGISAEPTERHTSLVERVTSVATGCRGAVMAGLNPLSAVFLMGYHIYLHILEWVKERDPVILAIWSHAPRSWGGLGLPNLLQMYVSGSGAAFEEGVATIQALARHSLPAQRFFERLVKTPLEERTATSVLTAPLSGRMVDGHMSDNRVSIAVRKALAKKLEDGKLSMYAERLLKYADAEDFEIYAEAIVPLGCFDVIQEQMLINLADAHPHSIFSAFARRLEKSSTVKMILGRDLMSKVIENNRREAKESVEHVYLNVHW